MSSNLFGWSNATWLLIDQWSILLGLVTSVITLLLLLAGALSLNRIRRWLTRNRFPEVGAHEVEGATWDGIVFTVSHEDTPRWVMEQLTPKSVAFIASEQSHNIAEQLVEVARGLSIEVALRVQVVDPDDPAQTRQVAAALLTGLRQAGAEKLAIDVTGGKTPMSLGAFMAAEESGAASLYVASRFDESLRKPDMRTARVRVISLPG